MIQGVDIRLTAQQQVADARIQLVLLDATGIDLPAQGYLVDAAGRIVGQFVVQSPLHEADLTGLAAGAYVVWLAGRSGMVVIR